MIPTRLSASHGLFRFQYTMHSMRVVAILVCPEGVHNISTEYI